MEAVIGLLLIILRVSHGEETDCDGRQDGAQCYGPLGGTVVIKLMDRTSETFKLYKHAEVEEEILYWVDNKMISNELEERSLFTPTDGKFRINNLNWSDGGNYTLKIFDSQGHKVEQRTLQLTIQGVETDCDGRQNGAQCYGALGGTVVIKLMDRTSETFKLYKHAEVEEEILYWADNKMISNQLEERSLFTPTDGKFRINNLNWSDGGIYILELFDSQGHKVEQRTLQLTIQDHTGNNVASITPATNIQSTNENVTPVSGNTTPWYIGVEMDCDGRQDGAQCYGALRGTVVIKLMDRTSETFKLYKHAEAEEEILYWVDNMLISNQLEKRSLFTPTDGKFRINNLNWSDGGNYTLKIFDSQGHKVEQRTLQLTIQGVKTDCDGRQDGAQCYGALRGTVAIKLMDRASETFKLYKHAEVEEEILYWVDNMLISNQLEERSLFTPTDGKFRINNLNWSDGGIYILELFDSQGRKVEQRTLQLTIQGVETDCDGRQDGAQCYGALGGTVVIKLMDRKMASEIYKLLKDGEEILDVRENKITTYMSKDRSLFSPGDGTFRINNLSRSDGGEYTLETFDSDGQILEQRTLQLTIQGKEETREG